MIRSLFILLFFPVSPLFAQPDLSEPFKTCNTSGSITLYHLESDTWTFSDSIDSAKESRPASTFKIFNSALALELDVVADIDEIIEWDGSENTFFGIRIEAWNKDTDMKTAFQTSAIWFYEELAKQIDRQVYKQWLDEAGYGNGDLDEPGHDFWNIGGFGVSPVGQIEFLKAFYREELSFSPATYEAVKKMMVEEESENQKISGKTGWTKTDETDIGWWIGYLEKEDETWFFATRITKPVSSENPQFSSCRKQITQTVFEQLDILE